MVLPRMVIARSRHGAGPSPSGSNGGSAARGSAPIPGSRLEIFEGVGHYPHCEAPERFVEVLVDFIASTEPARLPPHSSPPLDAAAAPD